MKRLVVLIPGWGSAVPYLKSSCIKKQFQKNGYDVAVVDGYPDLGLGCIKDNAARVDQQIKDLRYREVVFVGHSMGGLVARQLIKEHGHSPIALITLGTPHTGAKLSSLLNGISESMIQMNKNSDFLTEINATPPEMPTLSITGSLDFVVPKQDIDWMESVEVPKVTHLGLVASKRVFYEAWSWLTYDIFGEPGPYTDAQGESFSIKLSEFLPGKIFFHELLGEKPIFWR